MSLTSNEPGAIALIGLLLGMRHATDADHVVAVTTILSRERRFWMAARIGAVWGLGHTLTVTAVGAAIILLKIAIPARLGLAMEFAVALALVALGAGSAVRLARAAARRLRGVATDRRAAPHVHWHRHAHDDPAAHGRVMHSHPHTHAGAADHGHLRLAPEGESASHGWLLEFAARRPLPRSFAVGLIHGLAGSAAIALIVLSAIPRPLWAVAYLSVFCAGVVLGMAILTTAIATPFLVAARRLEWLHRGLVAGSGMLSFGFGLTLAYRIGYVDQLFGAAPLWFPH